MKCQSSLSLILYGLLNSFYGVCDIFKDKMPEMLFKSIDRLPVELSPLQQAIYILFLMDIYENRRKLFLCVLEVVRWTSRRFYQIVEKEL